MAFYETQTIRYSDNYDIPNLANYLHFCYEHFLCKEMPQVDELSKEFTFPILEARDIANQIAQLSYDEFTEFSNIFSSEYEQQEFTEFVEIVGAEPTVYNASVKVSFYNL